MSNVANGGARTRRVASIYRVAVALLLALGVAPSLLLVIDNARDLPPKDLGALAAASVFSLLALTAAAQIRPRPIVLILGLLALLGSAQLWFVSIYGWTFDVNTLSLLLETNRVEATDFIISLPAPLLLAPTLPIALATVAFFTAPELPSQQHAVRRLLFVSVTAIATTWFISSHLDRQGDPIVPDATFPASPRGQALAIRGSYALGTLLTTGDFIRDRAALKRAVEAGGSFSFGATSMASGGPPRAYVLVLGETARPDHFGLNGYHRDTTPLLGTRDRLLSLTKLHTVSTYTRLSIPVILSRKSPHSISATFREPSIVTVFKEVGFRTAWISLQAPLGYHESPVTVHAQEADEVFFLNPVDYRSSGFRDDAAIDALRQTLAKAGDADIFVVIHLLGSHFRYSDRYPAGFSHFTPDKHPNRATRLFEPGDKHYLVNSYDNSIRFTDYVLDGLISVLEEETERESWLLYVSDHGEALFDDCKLESGHGHQSPATNSVAALFWWSHSYMHKHPENIAAVRDNQHALASTSMIFETIADLADIEVPGSRTGNSLANVPLRVPKEITSIAALSEPRCVVH